MIASIWVINTQSRGPRGRRVPELMRQVRKKYMYLLYCYFIIKTLLWKKKNTFFYLKNHFNLLILLQCILRGLRRLVCLGDDAYFPLNEIDTLSMKSLDIPAVEPIVKSDISGNQSKLEKDVEEILRHVQTMIDHLYKNCAGAKGSAKRVERGGSCPWQSVVFSFWGHIPFIHVCFTCLTVQMEMLKYWIVQCSIFLYTMWFTRWVLKIIYLLKTIKTAK